MRDGRARLADRPGSLAAEGVLGPSEGSPSSRGGSERGPWPGGIADGVDPRQRRRPVTKGHPEKQELASAAAVRTLTQVTPTGAASASRRWPGAPALERRHFQLLKEQRRARNGSAREVPSFARCARASVWWQKSAGDVRPRHDPLVAAGGSDGGLARGQWPEAKSVEKPIRLVTGGEAQRPEEGRRLAEGVRCRGFSSPFTGWREKAASAGRQGWRRELDLPAGDTGVRGRLVRRVSDVNSVCLTWISWAEAGPRA